MPRRNSALPLGAEFLLAALFLSGIDVDAQRRLSAPGSAEAWSDAGARLARAGQIEKAIDAYYRALKLNPRLTPVYLNLGIAYFRAGRYSEAEKPLRTFLGEQAGNLQARQLLGLCLLEQDRFPEAIEELESAQQDGPRDLSLVLALATAYVRSGREQESRKVVEMLQQRGDSPELHLVLGIGYARGEETEKAIQEFQTARRWNPKLPWVHKRLAEVLAKLNRTDEAIPLYREELKLSPRDAEASYQLGAIFERRRRDAEAEKLLGAAIRFRPAYGDACYTLGKLYQRQGKLRSALTMLERAARLLPDNESAHYQLARLYQRLGRPKEAAEQFQITERLQQAAREKARRAISPE